MAHMIVCGALTATGFLGGLGVGMWLRHDPDEHRFGGPR